MLNTAGVTGELGAAKWLRLHGAQWPFVLGEALKGRWTERLLRWARAEGCTAAESDQPAGNAREDWLRKNVAECHRKRLSSTLQG
jgi:hypothetical protein